MTAAFSGQLLQRQTADHGCRSCKEQIQRDSSRMPTLELALHQAPRHVMPTSVGSPPVLMTKSQPPVCLQVLSSTYAACSCWILPVPKQQAPGTVSGQNRTYWTVFVQGATGIAHLSGLPVVSMRVGARREHDGAQQAK